MAGNKNTKLNKALNYYQEQMIEDELNKLSADHKKEAIDYFNSLNKRTDRNLTVDAKARVKQKRAQTIREIHQFKKLQSQKVSKFSKQFAAKKKPQNIFLNIDMTKHDKESKQNNEVL